MKLFLEQQEFLHEMKQVGFVLSTQRQIAKDFAASGYDFETVFNEEALTPEAIQEKVEVALLRITREGERQLLQLLYQVDIPQQAFLDLVQDPNFIPLLSEQIIRREAYKVYLRSKF